MPKDKGFIVLDAKTVEERRKRAFDAKVERELRAVDTILTKKSFDLRIT